MRLFRCHLAGNNEIVFTQKSSFLINIVCAVFVGAVSVFLGCYLVNKKIPINPAMMIMTPIGGGIIIALTVTRMESKKCQQKWQALQEKPKEESKG